MFMKVLQRIKNFFYKKKDDGKSGHFSKGKLIGSVAFLAVNVFSAVFATLAWFALNTKQSTIEMVTGDIDVDIKKVTAYKYVYPFFKSSTEYIDYNNGGTVKKFVLNDNELTYNDGENDVDVDSSSITSSYIDVTLSLSEIAADYSALKVAEEGDPEIVLSSSFIHYDGRTEFRYFLIGDELFGGEEDSSWSIDNSIAFAKKDDVTADSSTHSVANNVFISAGANFIFFDRYQITSLAEQKCKYFSYSHSGSNTSPFVINPDGKSIKCIKSGLYRVTYSPNKLRIEEAPTTDNSILGNNSLDVTKIKIDYDGSSTINKTNPDADNYFPSFDSYFPTGIYEQNTTLILDVELNYKNVNQITPALQVVRDPNNSLASSNYILNISNNGYSDTTKNIRDASLPNGNNINPLNASDFFSFYAQFTANPYANPNAIWTALHKKTDSQTNSVNDFKKFNTNGFDNSIDCPLHLKDELSDSLTIPPSSSELRRYHCYIVIEYDYEYADYFVYEKRLSQTFPLYRDFGFRLIGNQSLGS